MTEHPVITLERAIITRLVNDSRWHWKIFGYNQDVGSEYLLLGSVTSVDDSPKIGQIVDYFFSFDAHRTEPSARDMMLSHATVANMLYAMERIMTVTTDGPVKFSPLDLGADIRAIAHQVDAPLQIITGAPNEAHAREILKFKLCQ